MIDDEKRFKSRQEAASLLAQRLDVWRARAGALVLGLPRGGVVVAFGLAKALRLPMDILLVRKIGMPTQTEFALGAIASIGGVFYTVLSDEVISREQVSDTQLANIVARESAELARRDTLYQPDRMPLALEGRSVILADDGMATGSTMLAAISALRAAEVAWITVAVPVASQQALQKVRSASDDCVCLRQPKPFYSVGQSYEEFNQTSDAEVQRLLQQAQALRTGHLPSHQTDVKHKGDHRGL